MLLKNTACNDADLTAPDGQETESTDIFIPEDAAEGELLVKFVPERCCHPEHHEGSRIVLRGILHYVAFGPYGRRTSFLNDK